MTRLISAGLGVTYVVVTVAWCFALVKMVVWLSGGMTPELLATDPTSRALAPTVLSRPIAETMTRVSVVTAGVRSVR